MMTRRLSLGTTAGESRMASMRREEMGEAVYSSNIVLGWARRLHEDRQCSLYRGNDDLPVDHHLVLRRQLDKGLQKQRALHIWY